MYNVAVLGKHVSTGKTTTYYLKIGPWGTSEADNVSVPRQVYDALAENRSACIYRHDGAFDVPWFFAALCPFDQRLGGNGNRPNPEIGVLRQRAEAGDLKSIETLGLDYLSGSGVARDPVEAAHWLRQAADQGSSTARYNLGVIYQNGTGIERDYGQAAYWYRQAAADNPQAMVALGYLYSMGLGVTRDDAEARRYYTQAAERGNSLGAVNIAVMDANGRAGPVDHVSAFKWYMVAAQQGQPVAMNGVGYSYLTGNGVEQDVAKGFAWLRAAADAGQPNAMQTLGAELLTGANLPRDPGEAYRWLSLAVRNYTPGDEKLTSARALQARAAALLTDDQRLAIDMAVPLWRPIPGHPPG
jgi:TPR repeat protein